MTTKCDSKILTTCQRILTPQQNSLATAVSLCFPFPYPFEAETKPRTMSGHHRDIQPSWFLRHRRLCPLIRVMA